MLINPLNSIEAEQSVLGGIMLHNPAMDDVLTIINKNDFHDLKHIYIFEAMLDLYRNNQPTDWLTLAERLKRNSVFQECGGDSYLVELMKGTPSFANITEYAKIVRDFSYRRQLVKAANEILVLAQLGGDNVLDEAQQKILSIAENASNGSQLFKEFSPGIITELMELHERKMPLAGLSTGFHKLDEYSGGLMPGELTILAARPGMGKTMFALNIAEHVVFDRAETVLFFSMEMTKGSLGKRVFSSQGNIKADKLKTGAFDKQDIESISRTQELISHCKFVFNDNRPISTQEIRAESRRVKRKHGLDLIIIDYLGLIKRTGKENMNLQLGAMTKELRNLAYELNCPVLLLSQLNRNLESRTNKRPICADLRDSGEIEQDADMIIFIYRDEIYEPYSTDKNIAEINIAKNRTGQVGTVRLGFEGHYYRFTNKASAYESVPPTDTPLKDRYQYNPKK